MTYAVLSSVTLSTVMDITNFESKMKAFCMLIVANSVSGHFLACIFFLSTTRSAARIHHDTDQRVVFKLREIRPSGNLLCHALFI